MKHFISFTRLFNYMALLFCFIYFTSCAGNADFVGIYTGTTGDDLGEDIGVLEATFVVNLQEDNTFIESHVLTSDEGDILSVVKIEGKWGLSETEKYNTSRMTITGKTLWFKYDLSSLNVSSEEYTDELQPAYKQLFENENKQLDEAKKEDKVYGWSNVELRGDSLINSKTLKLIAIKLPKDVDYNM